MNRRSEDSRRRGFLRWLGGSGIAAAVVAASRGKATFAQAKPRPQYSGTSNTGDLKQALEKAVSQVPTPCCDRVVQWELVSIRGESGGIDGRHKLTATITAHIE